jgi:hypothetical protein
MSHETPMPRPCVFAYLTEPADTTIAEADTYQYINGVFDNDPVIDFELVADPEPAIKYLCPNTHIFEIDWHAVVAANLPNTIVRIGIKKNDTTETPSITSSLAVRNGEPFALSGTFVVSLEQNDTIQLICTTDGTGDVITISNFTTTIRAFVR